MCGACQLFAAALGKEIHFSDMAAMTAEPVQCAAAKRAADTAGPCRQWSNVVS